MEDDLKAEIEKQLEQFDAAMRLITSGIFKIQSKGGGLVVYHPKWEQRRLYRLIRNRIAKGEPAQIIILKARQVGFSTAIAILFLALALVRDTIDVVVASHEEKSRNRIWRIYQTAWRNLPEEYTRVDMDGKDVKRARYDSRRELEFVDNNTHIGVYVAGKGELGRSGATHCAHLSEFARWKNQVEDLNSVMESVPRDGPGAIAIIETTANGWGDTFHDMWLAAEKAQKEGRYHPWTPFFLPWWKEPSYKSRPKAGKKEWQNTDEEERLLESLVKEFPDEAEAKLGRRQLQWRRDKIAGDCGGNVRLFDQENPSTPEHAFQATGESVFDQNVLNFIQNKYIDEPLGTFDVELTSTREPFLRPTRLVYDDDDPLKGVPIKGKLRVYRHPENRDCILMADPTHAVSDNSDPAAIHIFDVNTLEQLATWEGRQGQHEFGDTCVALAKHYNGAFCVIETNIGLTTAQRMLDLGYGNIYWHKPTGQHHADPTWQPGYKTTPQGRDIAIRTVKRLLNEHMLVIYDARTLHELQSFQEIKTGTKFKAQAPKDKADNLVMALCVGMHVGNAKHGWTQDGKLMRRRLKPEEIKPKNPKPLHETPEQAWKRMQKERKRRAYSRAFDCR